MFEFLKGVKILKNDVSFTYFNYMIFVLIFFLYIFFFFAYTLLHHLQKYCFFFLSCQSSHQVNSPSSHDRWDSGLLEISTTIKYQNSNSFSHRYLFFKKRKQLGSSKIKIYQNASEKSSSQKNSYLPWTMIDRSWLV